MASPKKARGIKRSSLMKVQRQLLLLRLLCSGSRSSAELIEGVNNLMLDAYPQAAREALRHDLRALRDSFGCVIDYVPQLGYTLVSVGELALLDLSNDEIAALRWLDSIYSQSNAVPEHQHVQQLIARIVDLLPPERRAALVEGEPLLQHAGPKTAYPHDTATLRQIRRALKQRRELRFRYTPSLRSGEETHTVAPLNLFTRDGHVYLLAYRLDQVLAMEESVGGYVDFRVDYIVPNSTTVLPRILPPSLPKRPMWTLMYELTPEVARQRHVAQWFPDTIIEYRADGSALVTATIYNLWQARQILLRYAEHCRVLAPPELVSMMAETAQKLHALYGE